MGVLRVVGDPVVLKFDAFCYYCAVGHERSWQAYHGLGHLQRRLMAIAISFEELKALDWGGLTHV